MADLGSIGVTQATGRKSFTSGTTNLQYGRWSGSAVISFTVPSYWTGPSFATVHSGEGEHGDGAVDYPFTVVMATTPFGVRGFIAGSTNLQYAMNVSLTTDVVAIALGWTAATSKVAVTGTNAFTAGAELAGPYSVKWVGSGELAASYLYASLSMYMRKTALSDYQLKFDMGATDTLLTVYSNGEPLTSAYIGSVGGTHTLRGQVYNRNLYVFLDGETKFTYVDTRDAGPSVPDAPGRIGFSSQNLCLNTVIADFAGEPVAFVEDFETGTLASYVPNTGAGDPAAYELVGGQGYGNFTFRLTQRSGLYNRGINRTIPPIFTSELEWVFQLLPPYGNDDGLSIGIGSIVGMNMSREPGLDFGATDTSVGQSTGRPRLYLQGGAQLAMVTYRLPTSVWYRMRMQLSPVPNAGTYTLTRVSDNVVLASGSLPGTIPPQLVTSIGFGTDCSVGYTTTGGMYDNIILR